MVGDKPWPQIPVGNRDHTNAAVVIVGAGIAGMCTAIDLVKRNNCRNFIILEKSSGLGGTWHGELDLPRRVCHIATDFRRQQVSRLLLRCVLHAIQL